MKIIYKICNECNISLQITNFYNKPNSKGGVNAKCKDCIKKLRDPNKRKQYYKNNINKFKEYQKLFNINNLTYAKEYYTLNKDTINLNRRQWSKNKRKNDSLFKLSHNIRSLIYCSFKNQFTKKSKKTIEILGCSFEEFKVHLEKQFDDKMNWDNQGSYWDMDHIKPVSLATNEQELLELNHYTNFQPLYWKDNIKKSNKINYD